MRLFTPFLCFFLLLSFAPAHAGNYKCRTPEGKLVYQEFPCQGASKTEAVRGNDRVSASAREEARRNALNQKATLGSAEASRYGDSKRLRDAAAEGHQGAAREVKVHESFARQRAEEKRLQEERVARQQAERRQRAIEENQRALLDNQRELAEKQRDLEDRQRKVEKAAKAASADADRPVNCRTKTDGRVVCF